MALLMLVAVKSARTDAGRVCGQCETSIVAAGARRDAVSAELQIEVGGSERAGGLLAGEVGLFRFDGHLWCVGQATN
ncbi:hypothetical protein ACFWHQ_31780, partial [Streptomyces sp. NPDC060334]|uniref:hypothetical protein n=1 Tax=Streptomyces sp. NPDC060334 TaxID=3347099 RepID=UPI003654C86A